GGSARGLVACERFAAPGAGAAGGFPIGPPATLALETLGETPGVPSHRLDGAPHPTLEITTALDLQPGERRALWFRFGRKDPDPALDPSGVMASSLARLPARRPHP